MRHPSLPRQRPVTPLKKPPLRLLGTLFFRWHEMGDGHAEVGGQSLGSRATVARCKVFACAHQDDALSGRKYLGNHLLARLVIGKLDRPAVFVVAVAKRLHMLVPSTEELR